MYKVICKLLKGDSFYKNSKDEAHWVSHYRTLDEALNRIYEEIGLLGKKDYFGSAISEKSSYKIDGLNSYCELIADPVLVPASVERDDDFICRTPEHYTYAHHHILTIEEKACDEDLLYAKDELLDLLKDLTEKHNAEISWGHKTDDIITVSVGKEITIERFKWIEKENGKSERIDYFVNQKHDYAFIDLYKIDNLMCVRLFFNHPYKFERKMPLDKNETTKQSISWYSPGYGENYPRKDTNYLFGPSNKEKLLKSLDKILKKTKYTLKDMY